MLAVHNLSFSYGAIRVLEDVTMVMPSGQITCILGRNGAGKTTLLRIIAGLLSADRGRVCLDGVDITRAPSHKRNVGVVFQNYALFPHLSVADNVAFGLRAKGAPAADVAPAVSVHPVTGDRVFFNQVQLHHVSSLQPEVREAMQGDRPIRKLFTKEQRAFFAEHAPDADLDSLSVLGPITLLKLKMSPKELGRRLVAEAWFYPDGSRILELSTRCETNEAFQVAALTRAFLVARGVDLSGEQETKTRKALEFFSRELKKKKAVK